MNIPAATRVERDLVYGIIAGKERLLREFGISEGTPFALSLGLPTIKT